tara:strand:+ start:218 stop:619 length:402 start_codon:yes stop_codon:yes gene_type:complete
MYKKLEQAVRHLHNRNIRYEYKANELTFYTEVNQKILPLRVVTSGGEILDKWECEDVEQAQGYVVKYSDHQFVINVEFVEELETYESCEGCDEAEDEIEALREEIYFLEDQKKRDGDYTDRLNDLRFLVGEKF